MARKGAMGRDPKVSIGRDPMEMRRYQEALNRAKGMDVNSEAYARNKAIAETTGAKYGLNWQQGLTQGAQPRQQPNQKSAYEQELDRQRGPQLDTTANAQGQYRLSPGVYGTKEQAQQSYDQEMKMQQMRGINGIGFPAGINPYNDKMYRYPATQGPMSQEDYESLMRGVTVGGLESAMAVRLPDGRYGSPQELAQMMQGSPRQDMTANKQGKYRLSPGVYGNRQQAEQQQARDMEQFMANYPQAAVPTQEQDQGGGGGFREDFYKRALGMQQQNLGGVARNAGDIYKGVGREVGNYYGGIAKGTGNYYGSVAKKFKKLF